MKKKNKIAYASLSVVFAIILLLRVINAMCFNSIANYDFGLGIDMLITGNASITGGELDTLLNVRNFVWENFINKNKYNDESAYAMLEWNSHKVQLFVKTQGVYNEAVAFVRNNVEIRNLVDVVIAPKFDYRRFDGGANSDKEINAIVADEYLTIKHFLINEAISSNIYLTYKTESKKNDIYYTMIEVYVEDQASKDVLQTYMKENHFWQDVVKILITPCQNDKPKNTIKGDESYR